MEGVEIARGLGVCPKIVIASGAAIRGFLQFIGNCTAEIGRFSRGWRDLNDIRFL
jgi:hypothetical protein